MNFLSFKGKVHELINNGQIDQIPGLVQEEIKTHFKTSYTSHDREALKKFVSVILGKRGEPMVSEESIFGEIKNNLSEMDLMIAKAIYKLYLEESKPKMLPLGSPDGFEMVANHCPQISENLLKLTLPRLVCEGLIKEYSGTAWNYVGGSYENLGILETFITFLKADSNETTDVHVIDSEISVFVSYAREDAKAAKKLYADLKIAGVQPWLDTESLSPGQKWRVEIRTAIRASRYFLLLLSSKSVQKKGYFQKEIKEALDVLDEFPESDIYLLPIRLDECDTDYERIRELHRVDMFPDWNDGLQKVIRVLCPKKLDEVLLQGTINSSKSLVFPNNNAAISYDQESQEIYVSFTTPRSYKVNSANFYLRWRDNQWVVLQEFNKSSIKVSKITVETNHHDGSGLLKISHAALHVDKFAKLANDDRWLKTATSFQKTSDSNDWKKLDY
ncbi:toll/interleukin-1 receptor domain-containing protein [bacterium]|nr:toll/interleukin-1 receptor domain-containing protein [bacterium]